MKTAYLPLLALVVFLAFTVTGCGKRGAPVAPPIVSEEFENLSS